MRCLRDEAMSNRSDRGKTTIGCLVLILFVVVGVYGADFLSKPRAPRPAPASSPNNTPLATIEPTATVEAHYYGERVVFTPELVTIPMGVKFYTCQRLDCQVFFITGEADEWLVTAFIGGEVVEDVGMWVVIDILGTEVFAPLVDAIPRTPSAEVTP